MFSPSMIFVVFQRVGVKIVDILGQVTGGVEIINMDEAAWRG